MNTSVIIPIYKYKNYDVLRTVLTSLSRQTKIPEIIISEQGLRNNKIIESMAKTFGCQYILSRPDYIKGKEYFNIGRVRNVGASISSGDILYFSDVDICFIDTNYFAVIEQLFKSRKDNVWYQPMMFRLSLQYVSSFTLCYQSDQKINFPSIKHCLVDFDSQSKSVVCSQEGEYKAIVNKQPHMAYVSDYQKNPTTDFDYHFIETYSWRPEFHYGGIACTYHSFCIVGGYSEKYLNWGLEDGDFQWKLSSIYSLNKIISNKSRPLLHFEHISRCKNSIYIKNREIFEKRSLDGAIKAIKNDKYGFKSSFIYKWKNHHPNINHFFQKDFIFSPRQYDKQI